MELVVIWLLCGAIGAVVATNKGYDGCVWFAFSFAFGPLGFVLALVLPRNQKAVESRALERGELKKCPSCAELVRVEAAKCRFCGESLDGIHGPRPDPADDSDVRRLVAELRRPGSPTAESGSRQELSNKLRSGRGGGGTP